VRSGNVSAPVDPAPKSVPSYCSPQGSSSATTIGIVAFLLVNYSRFGKIIGLQERLQHRVRYISGEFGVSKKFSVGAPATYASRPPRAATSALVTRSSNSLVALIIKSRYYVGSSISEPAALIPGHCVAAPIPSRLRATLAETRMPLT